MSKNQEEEKSQALRYNTGKRQWSLVHMPSIEPMVEVLEFGAKKYSAHNWKKGLPISEIYDSLTRHMVAFMEGEDKDKESNLDHLGHAMCNLMFMTYMYKFKKEYDDRKKENV